MPYRISVETGNVSGMGIVTPDDDIILITSEGVIIRIDTEDISTYGRVTKGVRLVRLADGVKVISGASVQKDDAEDADIEDNAESADSAVSASDNDSAETDGVN